MNMLGTIASNSSRIFLGLVLVVAITTCSSDSTRNQIPTAKAGIIDLTQWDFASDGILPLDGEWEIYWNELLDPSDFRPNDSLKTIEYLELPGFWNNHILKGEKVKGDGYATLRLNVILGDPEAFHQIRIIKVYSAFNAWINNELVASLGKVGTSIDNASPQFGLKEIIVPAQSGNLEIVLQISNYHFMKGGARESTLIGHPEQITWYGKTKMGIDLIVISIIFILGVGVVMLYFLTPKNRSPLYFALACLFSVSQFLTENEMPIVYFFEGIQWETVMKIDFLSNYLRAVFFVAFFRSVFPGELSKIFSRGIMIWGAVFCLIILFTKAAFFSKTLIIFEIVVGLAIIYLVYGLVLALIRHRRGAGLSAIGMAAIMIAAINDILHNEMIIQTKYIFPFGLLIFMFAHSFLVSSRFAKLYYSVVRLTRRLISLDKIKSAFIKNSSRFNLDNPFKAILENANADKGFIYIWEETIWVLKVFLTMDEKDNLIPLTGISDFSLPDSDKSSFPYELINLAITDKQNIVSNNAGLEERLQYDPYIRKHHVKSVICVRIESQGKLIGLLYLENQISEGAFSNEILEMLDLLSPQLTNMLDNIEIFRQLEMLNRNLEKKVEERTTELNQQKEILEVANQKINDSINYARHIQDSILLPEEEIKHSIPELFIYNNPREAVSGDFYWFSKVNNFMVVAAIDCTGHGIPAAFMSMIGHTLLSDIVNGMNILKPSQILKYLDQGVKRLLHQDLSESRAQDGMDLAICTIDPDNRTLQYSGAKNPLYLVRERKLEVINADPWSIGGQVKRIGREDEVEFINHSISLDVPVSAYMFTDGYVDQSGGRQEEEFNIDRFQQLLLEISDIPMNEQKESLSRTMDEWKEERIQQDDMLVIGMRL